MIHSAVHRRDVNAAEWRAAVHDPWVELLQQLRRRFAGTASPQAVDDAVQEAVLTALRAAASGATIEDHVAFCATVMRRRLVDEHRALRPLTVGEAIDAFASERGGGDVDWMSRLRREGLEPPRGLCEILTRIVSGLRSTKRLARAMGRDPKSVRRLRRRLQSWLSLCHVQLATSDDGDTADSRSESPPLFDQRQETRAMHVVRCKPLHRSCQGHEEP